MPLFQGIGRVTGFGNRNAMGMNSVSDRSHLHGGVIWYAARHRSTFGSVRNCPAGGTTPHGRRWSPPCGSLVAPASSQPGCCERLRSGHQALVGEFSPCSVSSCNSAGVVPPENPRLERPLAFSVYDRQAIKSSSVVYRAFPPLRGQPARAAGHAGISPRPVAMRRRQQPVRVRGR
jgi:hypothetical protein